MRTRDDRKDTLDLSFYKKDVIEHMKSQSPRGEFLDVLKMSKDPTIRKGVKVRHPKDIERRGSPRATAKEVIVDALALGGFLLLLYFTARYLK